METIIFDGEDGSQIELGVVAQTRVNGSVYLLKVDKEEKDEEGSEEYILKDT